ncbi:hypothetical protein Pen02_66370 [Plantactinospora endophytica]|uniref:Uncharacterized protein n=1 Tax=Plantactinospora endophytica TaxID=673535 RepID=A0ABQ4EAL3_9ACTN|nr:hypothetical protein Pen02_66370 [Plantactinospora endophytica]
MSRRERRDPPTSSTLEIGQIPEYVEIVVRFAPAFLLGSKASAAPPGLHRRVRSWRHRQSLRRRSGMRPFRPRRRSQAQNRITIMGRPARREDSARMSPAESRKAGGCGSPDSRVGRRMTGTTGI